MIAIDTSALIAILSNEPERREFNEIIQNSSRVVISAASLLEARMVLYARSGDEAVMALDAFILKSAMEVVPVTEKMGDMAFEAYRRYGKGTGHPAGLNYGDCFSYALASEYETPLLFKGNDFLQTDISVAARN